MHVAAHIHDGGGPESEQLPQEVAVATLARWVDNDNGAVAREGAHGREDIRRGAGLEGDLGRGYVIQLRIPLR